MTTLVEEIKEWAMENYDVSYGATVLVECFTDEELEEKFDTLKEAMEFAELWTEQYEDIQYTIF